MELAMPITCNNTMDSYEDMFKEITRKLYGEDGLPEFIVTDRTSNSQDRISTIDYDVEASLLKQDDQVSAFGLAALMQNSFPTTTIVNSPSLPKPNQTQDDKWIISEDNLQWSHSKVASYNPAQKLFRCAECDCVGYLPRVAEHWLGTHSNLRVFQCPQCPYESAWARCVRMHLTRHHNISAEETSDALLRNNPVLLEVTRFLQCLRLRLEALCAKTQPVTQQPLDFQNNETIDNSTRIATQQQVLVSSETNNSSTKRYGCTYCPYATDRRDLFTRHENIHREEKPFQCYVCDKQFNRADHVKKHFHRIHREHPYDLNKIRRHPPKNASGMSFYHKYNSIETPVQSPDSLNAEMALMSNSLAIPSNYNNMPRVPINSPTNNNMDPKLSNAKLHVIGKGPIKKKSEKRFACCYCTWSGVDNWCLKRHMNTHLKPYICALCDYKAARSERLATHVLKVHNKRACSKCNFFADDSMQLAAHQHEHHSIDQRSRSASIHAAPISNTTLLTTSSELFSQVQSSPKPFELGTSSLLQHNEHLVQDVKPWKPHTPRQHGAARLFNYLEASDGSDLECESVIVEDVKLSLTHRIQSDFPEAGDVEIHLDEPASEDIELPPFVCKVCGCEFEDDSSLETHQLMHFYNKTSPANTENPIVKVQKFKYQCCICKTRFINQFAVMNHMSVHTREQYHDRDVQNKRSRKQSYPKKVVLPFLGSDDVEILWDPKSTFWSEGNSFTNSLYNKYMLHLITRKGFSCHLCSNNRLTQFYTKGSLVLHKIWNHSNKQQFQCEHCHLRFRHRYQVILHASRVHITKPDDAHAFETHLSETIREQLICDMEPVMPENISSPFLCNSFQPMMSETPTSSNNFNKLGMTVFDNPYYQSNSHMPIIIPSFPPT